MRVFFKVLLIVFPTVYIAASVYVAYRLLYGSGFNLKQQRPEQAERSVVELGAVNFADRHKSNVDNNHPRKPTVHIEIWGKAAISIYLWEHILKGEVYELQGGFVKEGHLNIEEIAFTFRWGPGVIQTTVPSDVENLVLVLNGRSPRKVSTAKQWLDYLPMFKELKHTILILLGDERCSNSWILPYLQSRGGPVGAVLLVYDSTLIDNVEVFQWPLGVATYRGFPDYSSHQDVDLTSPRSHLCNFLGTVYPNSTRQTLARLLETPALQDECIVRGRDKWVPLETDESLNFYINSLLKSDLTLNPVGMNTECYRIYEALALGSIPVVEDLVTPGTCDNHSKLSPLRLLKQHNAPLILIKNWHDLPQLLQKESQRTLTEKIERRIAAVHWYADFKKTIKQEFIRIVRTKVIGSR